MGKNPAEYLTKKHFGFEKTANIEIVKMKNKQKLEGFTLIELIVTIVIIGILATISLITFDGYQARAKIAKSEAQASEDCSKMMAECVANQNCGESGTYETYTLCYAALSSGPMSYPGSAQWTPASCFTIYGGTITGYDKDCGMNVITPLTIEGTDVIEISNNAFNNIQLTAIIIPNSVTHIGYLAFRYNQLTSIVIPYGVEDIKAWAFAQNNITSVSLPNTITSIGGSAFAYNEITSVTIPSSLTTIGDGIFRSNNITSITIPNSITRIENLAFFENNLSSITIPDSVTSIGTNAFRINPLRSVGAVSMKSGTIYESNSFDPECTEANGCISFR